MENRLRSASKSIAVSSLSLSVRDSRGRYASLGHNEMISLASPSAGYSETSGAAAAASSGMPTTLCLLANGRRIQQRYKLLVGGPVQVCRVPHAKNIIEKIRFSRFLRRWEDHQINLDQGDIRSTTVSTRGKSSSAQICIRASDASRKKDTWIDRSVTRPSKTSRSGLNPKWSIPTVDFVFASSPMNASTSFK